MVLSPYYRASFISTDIPDQVIRVFKADQQSCYIIISKDTTAKDVVSHAVNEFGLTAAAETYSLCEVSISPEGVIKQRRLPEQLSKLADRIQLNGRYGTSERTDLSFFSFYNCPTQQFRKKSLPNHTCWSSIPDLSSLFPPCQNAMALNAVYRPNV